MSMSLHSSNELHLEGAWQSKIFGFLTEGWDISGAVPKIAFDSDGNCTANSSEPQAMET